MANSPWSESNEGIQELAAFTKSMQEMALAPIHRGIWGNANSIGLEFLDNAQEEVPRVNIWDYNEMPVNAQKVPSNENNTLPVKPTTVNIAPQTTVKTNTTPLDFSGTLSLVNGVYQHSNPVVHRVMQIESNGNPRAVSNTGALGLMQLTGGPVKDYVKATGDVGDIKDPYYNAKVGAWYLQRQYDQLRGLGMDPTVADVYRAYNMGLGGYKEVLNYLNNGKPLSNKIINQLINNTPAKYRTGTPAKDWINFTKDKFKDIN